MPISLLNETDPVSILPSDSLLIKRISWKTGKLEWLSNQTKWSMISCLLGICILDKTLQTIQQALTYTWNAWELKQTPKALKATTKTFTYKASNYACTHTWGFSVTCFSNHPATETTTHFTAVTQAWMTSQFAYINMQTSDKTLPTCKANLLLKANLPAHDIW